MQDEMKSEFKKTLTNNELDRLEALTKSISQYQKEYSSISIERLNIETEKQNLEQEIRTTLYPRRDQLKSRSVAQDDNQLDERKKELISLQKALADILARQKSTETEVDKIAKLMRENTTKLTELKVCIDKWVYIFELIFVRIRMQILPVRLRGIKRLLNKVWRKERIYFINEMNVIKEFEILVFYLKKHTRNIKMLIPQKFDPDCSHLLTIGSF